MNGAGRHDEVRGARLPRPGPFGAEQPRSRAGNVARANRLHRPAPRGGRDAPRVPGVASRGPRDQGAHAPAPRPLPGALRGAGARARRTRALGEHAGRGTGDRPRHLPRRRRAAGHQGEVHGGRGDRAERRAGGRGLRGDRDRSRRVHHPARERAAEPHHRAGDPQDQGPDLRPLPRPSREVRTHRAPDGSGGAGRRGAGGAAREVPECGGRDHRRELPGRRDRDRASSSPTRATATSPTRCPGYTS